MTFHIRYCFLLSLGAPFAVQAQAPALTRAAATITAADVRRRIGIVSDDSMGGRNTPSPGLDKAARYVAAEFKRFGLRPGGDSGGYLMRYPISRMKLLAPVSTITFSNGAEKRSATLSFRTDAALSGRALPAPDSRGPIVIVGGNGSVDSVPGTALLNHVVLFVADWKQPGTATRFFQLSRLASRAGARGIVAVVNSDSIFAARYGAVAERTYEVAEAREGFFSVAVREDAVSAQIAEAADQFAQVREQSPPMVQPVEDWEVAVALKDTALSVVYAPDVVGILEGSDPVLKNEYLVYSAHMDHIGTAGQPGAACGAMGADSICNGADDDASGTASVLELAEAYSQRGVRPKRSVIFVTVSGEEHGLWGSAWFVQHPPVPLPQIVADLNSDMIGRNWPDTIVVIGKEHSDLGSTLNRVNAAHAELNMHAIDDRWPEQRFYQRSDHYNFAQRGVPILFFFNGTHPDYHRPSDSVEKIDAEKESRIVQLLFYLGQDVANAKQRPQWVPQSYKAIVTP